MRSLEQILNRKRVSCTLNNIQDCREEALFLAEQGFKTVVFDNVPQLNYEFHIYKVIDPSLPQTGAEDDPNIQHICFVIRYEELFNLFIDPKVNEAFQTYMKRVQESSRMMKFIIMDQMMKKRQEEDAADAEQAKVTGAETNVIKAKE